MRTNLRQREQMDTLTLDVKNLPEEKIRELRRLVEHWKREAAGAAPAIGKRQVDPSEFAARDSKLKAPYNRALAYED